MSKFLTFSLFTVAASFLATAMPSYWATAETGAAKGDTTKGGGISSYSAYCWTLENAAGLFKVENTVGAVEAFLASNFTSGRTALSSASHEGFADETVVSADKAGALTTRSYVNDQYVFAATYGDALALGSTYLAMLFYENGEDLQIRVMVNDPDDLAKGNALFSDNALASAYSASNSGVWTPASNVPEPTSALLLLLGVAGLSLRRRKSV